MDSGPSLAEVMGPPQREIKPVQRGYFMTLDGLRVYLDKESYDRVKHLPPEHSHRQSAFGEIGDINDTAPYRPGGRLRQPDLKGKYYSNSGGLVYITPEGSIVGGFASQENIDAVRDAGYTADPRIAVPINGLSVVEDPRKPNDRTVNRKFQRIMRLGKNQSLREQRAKQPPPSAPIKK